TALLSRRDAKRERRKLLRSHWLERQRRQRHRIEHWYPGIRHAVRMRERVQHGQFHARDAELGQDAAVHELDERMYDALRMDNDLDALVRQTEQIVRFDDLERLVGECRAIDRDLAT